MTSSTKETNPILLFAPEEEKEILGCEKPEPLRYFRGTESLIVTPEDSVSTREEEEDDDDDDAERRPGTDDTPFLIQP